MRCGLRLEVLSNVFFDISPRLLYRDHTSKEAHSGWDTAVECLIRGRRVIHQYLLFLLLKS